MSAKYVPIRVSTLRGDQQITFDVYVKVAGKYILYCREGDSFEGERLERLISKKLKKMYIRPEQASLYDAYIKENISRAYGSTADTSLEIKAQIIQGAIQACAEDLMEDLNNEALFRLSRSRRTKCGPPGMERENPKTRRPTLRGRPSHPVRGGDSLGRGVAAFGGNEQAA